MSKSILRLLCAFTLIALAACSGPAATPTGSAPDPTPAMTHPPADSEGSPANQPAALQEATAPPEGQEIDRSYKLVTGVQDGRMVFIGSGGPLDGVINPELTADLGEVVEIVLVNGDSIVHNVALEGYGLKSEDIHEIGQETRLVFTADKAGAFIYFCAIPGHRQAGMEGRITITGDGAAADPDAPQPVNLPSIALPADAVPPAVTRTAPDRLTVELETVEVNARLADGAGYTFWTFNGTVPGPMIRIRVGDTVEVRLRNAENSHYAHSVDFHAVTGPGGGAAATQTMPGEETSFTFKALNPGVYVYHCATPSVAQHISNGMYGLIVVEPEGGLPPVDREFYVMQGEIYTVQPYGQPGVVTFSPEKMLAERPEYFFFNGAVGSLTELNPLRANVGETVRIFFGVGGPNFTSSFHVIGEIFDRVYDLGSLTAPPLTDVQSVLVPTGGSAVVEFTLDYPGTYVLVDHSLSRAERGLAGHLIVEGEADPEIFDSPEGLTGE
ncbi:MAG TPA: nitrite reductase, copper-containing [Chloroflexi bacterium]|nr:nitrite reductase, copper-containing [Chloroflexota bacterium]HPO57901.1 copper-containing nitrite reductase [Anaerolineaceae bacterium]